jgi:hypothetical protein
VGQPLEPLANWTLCGGIDPVFEMGFVQASCPTDLVEAPIEVVWDLLSHPEGWGAFYDIRILSVEPAGRAAVGQRIAAETGPSFLHLKVSFEFVAIDEANHRVGIRVRLPLGLSVFEDLDCCRISADRCRVNYHCNFSFPDGWRGKVLRLLLRRELQSGPADSLFRLKNAAESRLSGK